MLEYASQACACGCAGYIQNGCRLQIPLLAKGSWAPINEAFAELTGISTCALFGLCGLCGLSYVILSIPQCLNLLKSCMVYNV